MRSLAGSCLLAACVVSASAPAVGQQGDLEGTWSGSGTVILPTGDRERARCRATFTRRDGKTFAMSAICATASTRVAQSAQLARISSRRYAGDFYNSEYSFSGEITINLQGNRLNATLVGGGGSAQFHLSK